MDKAATIKKADKKIIKADTKKTTIKTMKAMRPMKKCEKARRVTGRKVRAAIFAGTREMTRSGLKWMKAIKSARSRLGLEGFIPVGGKTEKGKALYDKAKSLMAIHNAGTAQV